jgi:ribosomal protein S3
LYTLLVENEEEIHINHFQIHLIQTKTTKDLIAVTVTLGKPGLLIGVSGLRIKHIQNKLTILLYKEVKVEIKEFDVWS